MRVGRAFVGASPVEQGHLFGAEPLRRGGRVERGAAAADDADPPADVDPGRPAVDRAADQIERVDDPVELLAGDAEPLRPGQPDRDDDRVVVGEQGFRAPRRRR